VNNWVILPEARRRYGPGVTAGDVLGSCPTFSTAATTGRSRRNSTSATPTAAGLGPSRGEWEFTAATGKLKYGDPAMMPLASVWMPLSGELLLFYRMLLIAGAGGLFSDAGRQGVPAADQGGPSQDTGAVSA
jgi:hypothetical protein